MFLYLCTLCTIFHNNNNNNRSKDINDMLYNLCILAGVSLVYSLVYFVRVCVFYVFLISFFSCVFMCVLRARFL